MEVTIQRVEKTEINFTFIQNLDEQIDDITPLYTSLGKMKKLIGAPGFKNDFTKVERQLWEEIFKEILKENRPIEETSQ